MKKTQNLRLVLSSSLVALSLWSIPVVQAHVCTLEYVPVCGQIADQAPRTFSNRCTLNNAQARPIAQGECPHATLSQPVPPPPPMPGSDAQVCKGSAGFVWNAELASCVRPWMSHAITLEVGAHRQKCTGRIEMQCLMVRELLEGRKKPRWEPLVGDIEGYQHQAGKRQLLRVRKDRQENVPVDAPSITYKFIQLLP